jgi:hypothetical protein
MQLTAKLVATLVKRPGRFAEVAALKPEKADRLLDWREENCPDNWKIKIHPRPS